MCKVYTGYCGTSEIEHGLCACTIDNPLAKARGLSLRTDAQTMLYLSLVEYVNVERLPEDGNRHKRSSTILLPDTMKLRFKIEAGEVTFNLEKAEHFPNPSPSPVYTIEESGIKLRNHKTKVSIAATFSFWLL